MEAQARAMRVSLLAPRARLSCEPGATPQGYKRTRASAESATHPKALFGYCPLDASVAIVIHAFSARSEAFNIPGRCPRLVMNQRRWR